jgi:hypothetical protein
VIFVNGSRSGLIVEWLLFVGTVKKYGHNVTFGNGK